jgi:NitT/TauT family transport system ATP-binding protein
MGIIDIQNLYYQYPDDNNQPALTDVNLSVQQGEFICVLGASGCGKTTLLSILEGLRKPSGGRVLISGKKLEGPGPERGVVFQHYSLFPWMSARTNIVFGLKQARKGLCKKEMESIADSYLAKVGLEGFEDKKPAQLSGGMQQRVAIARALAMNAQILLLDEPFGAVDAKNRKNLQELVSKLHEEEKKTFFFITHDVDEAILLADRIVFMVPRRIYKIFEIEIPKPRYHDQLSKDARFIEIRKMLIGLFYENYSSYDPDSAEVEE